MAKSAHPINVYLEIGTKKTIAGAVDWPGWCRIGQDEQSALEALHQYGLRYAKVLQAAGIKFQEPAALSAFEVVERLKGSSATDFGVPEIAPSSDSRPVDDDELQRQLSLLDACWQALDSAAQAAVGKELRKGPRGGGRELEGIIDHVLGGGAGYLSRIGWKMQNSSEDLQERLAQIRADIVEALTRSAHGEVPEKGPRGGARWSPRYFVRRSAWHILDHAWEIEDRVI